MKISFKTNLPFLLLLALAGCEDRQIKVYQIAKETAPAVTSATDTRPQWTVPPSWKELPPSGMRAASFSVSGTSGSTMDISVVTFPGQAGGLLANLNRWRGQMKLAPATETKDLETLDAAGQPVQIVELSSATDEQAMLGAILLRDDQSWFIKLTGSRSDVHAEDAHFRAFAQSFRFSKPAGPTVPAVHSTNDG